MSIASTKDKDAEGGREGGRVDGESLQGLEAPCARRWAGAALDAAGAGDTSSKSRSSYVLDGEPADEPLGLPGIGDGEAASGGAGEVVAWMGAGEGVAGGGGWWSGARKGNRLRERCDYGLACVVGLVYQI
jgi:hypothetical protein